MAALFILSLALLSTLSHVLGQDGQGIFTNATCYPTDSWMNNGIGQSPCLVAAYLSGACNNGQSSVYAIAVNNSYWHPAGTGINPCQCSAPVYNLMQACSYCQGGQPDSWTFWTFSCPTSYVSKSFPSPIPGGTEIPPWALLDPTLTGRWNYSVALANATSTSASITPYAMTSSSTSSTPVVSFSTSPSPSPSLIPTPVPEKRSSHTGAIAGGVVGGTAVLILLILGARYIRSKSVPNRERPSAGWSIDNSQSDLERPDPESSTYAKDGHSVSATSPTTGVGTPLPSRTPRPSNPSTFVPADTASPPPSEPGLVPFNPTVGTPRVAESPTTQRHFSSVEMFVAPAPTPAQITPSSGSPAYVSGSDTIDYGKLTSA